MILTFDTAKIDLQSLEKLAEISETRANLCEHLSGAVPDGYEMQLLNEADEHRETASKLRAELRQRRAHYVIRHANLMKV